MKRMLLKYLALSIMLFVAMNIASQNSYMIPQLTQGSVDFIDSVMIEDFVMFKAFGDLRAISNNEDSHFKKCYFTGDFGRPNWKPIIIKSKALKRDALICVEYTETKNDKDTWYNVDIYRYVTGKERGDTLAIFRIEDLGELCDKIGKKHKHLRVIYDDIMYMNKWYHSHLSEQLLYYPSVVMTSDGVRNIAGTKSYGFIIIYTSDDYTPLPTRYRRMIL
ncbi:MAG: hypothetical protein ACI30Q_01855 [Muribaculaceae bacterium]